MIEVKHYICEICRTEFNNECECRRCENGHIKPVKFRGWSYYSSSINATGAPRFITIAFDDGNEYEYRRMGED